MTIYSVTALNSDTRAEVRKQQLISLGWPAVAEVSITDVYRVDLKLSAAQKKQLAALLHNPVNQKILDRGQFAPRTFDWAIEISYKPGVTDNVAHTVEEQLELLEIPGEKRNKVHTSQVTFIRGKLSLADITTLSQVLANPLIQSIAIKSRQNWKKTGGFQNQAELPMTSSKNVVSFVNLHISDEELKVLGSLGIPEPNSSASEQLRRGPLSLSVTQLHAIRDYFKKLGRQPTDIELESIAQNWSEHCRHTIFASPIDDLEDGLFDHYIKAETTEIHRLKGKDDVCVSVFSDNAGAVIFDDEFLVCDKVETHNSPSALDPFGGAITGIVGVNRDIIGFGLGAKPVVNRYGFCLPSPDDTSVLYRDQNQKWPVLSPQQIITNVIRGVGTGGNCSGIPTTQGFLVYDSRYRAKPLVFAGTVGLIPRTVQGHLSTQKQAQAGDLIVVVGGRVGLDGIHGATFSSQGIASTSPTSAVQIGDPITQKKLSDVLVKEARDQDLFTSITDNGAGGLSCSISEMARESGGCQVQLDTVPLKYAGLQPWQIWISESQERMTLAVPPDKWPTLHKLLKSRGVEGAVIGEFTDTGKCLVQWHKKEILNLDLKFLHQGWPKLALKTQKPVAQKLKSWVARDLNWSSVLLDFISRPNLRSFADITTYYDHEVQGGSLLKPLQGRGQVNADVTAVRPVLASPKSVVLSQALYPSYSEQDPFAMAANSIDTAIKNLVTAGAEPEKIVLLDNFCWCSSFDPERLYQLKEATRACYETALIYQTPFISGKDSMFNDFSGYDQAGQPVKISALPTLLISGLAVADDGAQLIPMDFQAEGDLVYVLGETNDELGGSEYQQYLKDVKQVRENSPVPHVNATLNQKLYQQYHQAVSQQFVTAAQGVGRGGLLYALSKMAMAGKLGAKLELNELPGMASFVESKLFSESAGRIVATISPQFQKQFEKIMKNIPAHFLGTVQGTQLLLTAATEQIVVDVSVEKLLASYKAHLTPDSNQTTLVNQSPRALVISGYGINCEEETAFAFEQVSVKATIMHIDDLIKNPGALKSAQILAIPGGFSYGDDTGSGLAMANKMKLGLWPELLAFCERETLTIGICNGFQVLTNLGLVPALDNNYGEIQVALTHNDNARYTDRWVDLIITSQSPWLKGIHELSLPIAHGEGKLVCDDDVLTELIHQQHVAACYTKGEVAQWYDLPANPNGSLFDIAALTDQSGRILGIMPHPERAIAFTQLPNWRAKKNQLEAQGRPLPKVGPGLQIFRNAADFFKKN